MDRSTAFRAALERACVRAIDGDYDCTKGLALELKDTQQTHSSGSGAGAREHSVLSFAKVMDGLWKSVKSVEGDRGLILEAAAISFFTDAQLCEICDLLVAKYCYHE